MDNIEETNSSSNGQTNNRTNENLGSGKTSVFNIADGFSKFSDLWSPKIAGEVNNMHIKLVKVNGDFVWHQHENEDELFFVIKGTLYIKVKDPVERVHTLHEGEFLIIPRGVEHCPFAEEECQIILLEPKGTLNTGDAVENEKTCLLRSITISGVCDKFCNDFPAFLLKKQCVTASLTE